MQLHLFTEQFIVEDLTYCAEYAELLSSWELDFVLTLTEAIGIQQDEGIPPTVSPLQFDKLEETTRNTQRKVRQILGTRTYP